MTIRSSPGTRAEMLPLVQATSPLRGSSWWSSASSARRAATASAMDGLLGADAAQLVHDVVAAAAEVVVQADVARVELVVDVGPRGVGLVGVAPLVPHRRRGLVDVGVGPGRHGRVDRRAERRPL